MATESYAARSTTYAALAALDRGEDVRTEAFMCKLFVAESRGDAQQRQGLSDPPSGVSRSRVDHAARKVSDMISSAFDQSPVSRRAWL